MKKEYETAKEKYISARDKSELSGQKLNEQERKLIELRYFQNQTQAVIAGIMGISQVQVSRMEKKILEKLRMHSLN